jgi:hypothetical protein
LYDLDTHFFFIYSSTNMWQLQLYPVLWHQSPIWLIEFHFSYVKFMIKNIALSRGHHRKLAILLLSFHKLYVNYRSNFLTFHIDLPCTFSMWLCHKLIWASQLSWGSCAKSKNEWMILAVFLPTNRYSVQIEVTWARSARVRETFSCLSQQNHHYPTFLWWVHGRME